MPKNDINDDDIEVLETDDFEKVDENNAGSIIGLDTLFQNDEEEVIDVYEEKKKKEDLVQKRITKIQIGLIVFLAIFATLFYFFGYDLVEPYIKIS